MAKRSPFPRKSLPQAGESLRDAAFDLIFDKFFLCCSMAITIGMVGIVELFIQWRGQAMPPRVWIGVALVLGAFSAWRWFHIKPQLNMLIQGMRGEREVGRMLDGLRSLGYTVFHDIPGDGFNIDHVLIGPGGVFAVETKTWSKPDGRRAEIDYQENRLLVDGHARDRDPVAQAEAVSDYLRDILKRMTDRDLAVRPVLLFPGWWINSRPANGRAWVLNPKSFISFLGNEPVRLSREDVALFVDRLTVHLSSD